MSFLAQYPGECTRCDEPIKVGQGIDGDSEGCAHVVCPVVDRPVCGGCFLELPASGVCGVCE